MAVDFDRLNRETCEFNHRNVRMYSNNDRMGMSPSEYLAYKNNETYRSNNSSYPDRLYTSSR